LRELELVTLPLKRKGLEFGILPLKAGKI